MLLRSRSVGRPRKLYHTITHNNEENDSEDDEASEKEDLPEENSDDDSVFIECNLTVTHDPKTWQEAKQSDDVEAWRAAMED